MIVSSIKKYPSWITILAIWLWIASCNGCKEAQPINQEQVVTLDDLVRNNKKVHEQEMLSIESYVKEKNWPVIKTGTGLQYWVYENGNGQTAQLEDIVTLAFRIELMDGTACYSATADNPKKFRVGRDNVESGLHEVVQLLHIGDKAKVVLPSHLAFGLTGDNNKIPQNATVIYDLQIIAVE